MPPSLETQKAREYADISPLALKGRNPPARVQPIERNQRIIKSPEGAKSTSDGCSPSKEINDLLKGPDGAKSTNYLLNDPTIL